MGGSTKENGSKINAMVKALKCLQMAPSLSVCLKITKRKVKDSTLGPILKSMKVSGKKVSSKATVSGRVKMATRIAANGTMAK